MHQEQQRAIRDPRQMRFIAVKAAICTVLTQPAVARDAITRAWRGRVRRSANRLAASRHRPSYRKDRARTPSRDGRRDRPCPFWNPRAASPETRGLLGGVTRPTGGTHGGALEDIDALLDRLFTLVAERDLDIDLHVDEAAQVGALPHVARATIRHGYQSRVTCGHCCSLALLPEAEAEAVIRLVAEAGLR